MLPLIVKRFSNISIRNFSSGHKDKYNVTIIGASSKIASFIMFGLKQSKYVKEIRAFDDDSKLSGITMDIDEIATEAKVVTYGSSDQLKKCLLGSDVVAICGGASPSPGEKIEDHFETNAQLIRDIVPEIGRRAPFATTVIITEPINSLVPMAATYLLKERAYEPDRLLGATGIAEARAQVYLARKLQLPSSCIKIPVIGGHSDKTLLPLISQAKPCVGMGKCQVKAFIEQVRNSAQELLEAKGSPPVMAAGYRYACLIDSILRGKAGQEDVFETAFIQSDITDACFFSSRAKLGRCGVKDVCPLPEFSCVEYKELKKLLARLKKDIAKGCAYANKNPGKSDFCKKKDTKCEDED